MAERWLLGIVEELANAKVWRPVVYVGARRFTGMNLYSISAEGEHAAKTDAVILEQKILTVMREGGYREE